LTAAPSRVGQEASTLISGHTSLIAHLGYPTESFKAPMIYNPWFENKGIDTVVVPMGVRADDYPAFFRSLFRLSNIRGALITMPHKVTTVGLLDETSLAVKIAGSCNAVLRRDDGSLLGDMFDGEGFTRGARRKGFDFAGADCLVVGTGGVGSAIAAAIAAQRPRSIALCDIRGQIVASLAERLRQYYSDLPVHIRETDPAGYDLVVNATPLGMQRNDPLPFDPGRLNRDTFVGEVVLSTEMTPLLLAAEARGCRYQIGTDMLFEQIPAYLEFFGYGVATPEELREIARISY
jgi:shikimate dehydrogenase